MLIALALAAAAVATSPPPVIAARFKDGRFDPADFSWMRGWFNDAGPADRAAFIPISVWLSRCRAAGLAQTRVELAPLGVAEPASVDADYRDPACAAVASAMAAAGGDLSSFAAFKSAADEARPYALTFAFATRMAELVAGPRGETLADALTARTLGEQMMRFAAGWGSGGETRGAPQLSPRATTVLQAYAGIGIAERDYANTDWLKGIVARQGWPVISKVGERAADAAWLLVQHADADPPFQLRALRLMEPLVAKGEVSPRNFAYLYDRVMLKIAGKQRYATQMTCDGPNRVPQPLEDPAAVDRWRRSAGLDPLADYRLQMDRMFGPCQPVPAPSAFR